MNIGTTQIYVFSKEQFDTPEKILGHVDHSIQDWVQAFSFMKRNPLLLQKFKAWESHIYQLRDLFYQHILQSGGKDLSWENDYWPTPENWPNYWQSIKKGPFYWNVPDDQVKTTSKYLYQPCVPPEWKDYAVVLTVTDDGSLPAEVRFEPKLSSFPNPRGGRPISGVFVSDVVAAIERLVESKILLPIDEREAKAAAQEIEFCGILRNRRVGSKAYVDFRQYGISMYEEGHWSNRPSEPNIVGEVKPDIFGKVEYLITMKPMMWAEQGLIPYTYSELWGVLRKIAEVDTWPYPPRLQRTAGGVLRKIAEA